MTVIRFPPEDRYTDRNLRLFKLEYIHKNAMRELTTALRNDLDDSTISTLYRYLYVVVTITEDYPFGKLDIRILMDKRIKYLEELIASDYVDDDDGRISLLEAYRAVRADYSDLVVIKRGPDN